MMSDTQVDTETGMMAAWVATRHHHSCHSVMNLHPHKVKVQLNDDVTLSAIPV